MAPLTAPRFVLAAVFSAHVHMGMAMLLTKTSKTKSKQNKALQLNPCTNLGVFVQDQVYQTCLFST